MDPNYLDFEQPLAELEAHLTGPAQPTEVNITGPEKPNAEPPEMIPKQMEVGDQIFERSQTVLGDAWESFTAVEFLVLTANLPPIRDRTMKRLAEQWLPPDSEDEHKRVVFSHVASKHNLDAWVHDSN